MKKKKKLVIIITVTVAIVSLIIAGIIYFMKNRSGSVVDVYPMEMLNSSSWFENDSQLSGTITSDFVQEVYADQDQNVEKVYVKKGDTVKQGDKLLKYNVEEQELDVKLQKLQIQAAQVDIERMEKELETLKKTKSVGAVDASGTNLLSASINLASFGNGIMASLTEQGTDEVISEETETTGVTSEMKQNTKAAETKEGEDNDLKSRLYSLIDNKDQIDQELSGDGKTAETAYVYLLVKTGEGDIKEDAKVKGEVVTQLLQNKEYAVFRQYESEDAFLADKDNPQSTLQIAPDKVEIGITVDNNYTLEGLNALVIQRQLKDNITSVNDFSSGKGTKEEPYIYLLSANGKIRGTAILNLIEKKQYATFEEYASEKAYHDKQKAANTLTITANLEKPYVTDDIVAGSDYSISEINTKLHANLRRKITSSEQNDSGEGTEGSHFIFLLNKDGKVKGSVILELIRNEYYAYFREYSSENDYLSNKKNPVNQLEIRPEYLTNGILSDQEYTLDDLKNLLKEPEENTVLKSVIKDREKDLASGKGTASNPYVYLLIKNGVIRGSVLNEIIANKQYAVFYEYESEEVYKAGTDKNPVQIAVRPGIIFKENLSSFAGYTINDLNDMIVTADKIEITPERKSVRTGKTYTFKTKLTGKNKEALKVTWELKRNKSQFTTLVDGVLKVGSDETATSLRITARAGNKQDVLTLKVVKDSSSSNSGSTTTSTKSDTDTTEPIVDVGGGSDGDFSDSSVDSYTAEELSEAISEKESEIAEAKQNLNEAKINYKEAKKEVDAATVKAKVSGKVTVAYTADSVPTDGSAAIVVRADDGMYVNTAVSEMNLDTIQVGGTILCTSWETGQEYEAVVKEISDFPTAGSAVEGASNPNSSYYPVVAYIQNAEGLSTGESVSISYSSQSMGTVSDDAIYLQKAYIRTEGRQSYVYKEGKKGRLTKQYIKTGETIYGQYVQVISGITMDDNLAFPYGKNVKEGAKVQLSEDEDNIIY